MRDLESNIVYENNPLYVYRMGNAYEIRVNKDTYALALGLKPSEEEAIAFCHKLERYPNQLNNYINN